MSLQEEIDRRIADGLTAVCIDLANEAKRVLSVPAPRVRVLSARGIVYYRAKTPAIQGAPPRRLSGRGRASVAWEVDRDNLVGRVGTNVVYMRRHERQHGGGVGDHPWLSVAAANRQANMTAVMGAGMSGSIGAG